MICVFLSQRGGNLLQFIKYYNITEVNLSQYISMDSMLSVMPISDADSLICLVVQCS